MGATLYYSLDSAGVALSGLQKVRALVQQQLRAISRMLTHLTKVSNQELLGRLEVTESGTHILQGMQRLLQRWRASKDDIHCIHVKARETMVAWRNKLVSGPSDVLQREQQGGRDYLTCRHCGLACANKSTLGSHIGKVHAASVRPVFNRLKHSVDGMPRCSGCKQLLSSWSRLQKHIEKRACPYPVGSSQCAIEQTEHATVEEAANPEKKEPTGPSDEGPLQHDPFLRQLVQKNGWRTLSVDQNWLSVAACAEHGVCQTEPSKCIWLRLIQIRGSRAAQGLKCFAKPRLLRLQARANCVGQSPKLPKLTLSLALSCISPFYWSC